jgi:uroporphyrinogen decarboxylase
VGRFQIFFPWGEGSHGRGWFADPLLVRAARKEKVERAPAWMMRQAGRYMADYRKLAEKHPSFRERSENTDLIVEISLQPWKAFRPDGVIIFSDILTPLPAIGIPFEIDEAKGPVLESPIQSEEGLKALHSIDLNKVNFVGESLSILRREVNHLHLQCVRDCCLVNLVEGYTIFTLSDF